jgi:hypothetical protein
VWRLLQRKKSARRPRLRKLLRKLLKQRSKTPRNPSKLPKWVSAKPHKLQLQRPSDRSVLVVLQRLLKLYLLLQPRSRAADEQSSYLPITHKVDSTSCLQASIYYSTTKSCDNSHRCCFYSLIFAVPVVLMGRAARDTGGTRYGRHVHEHGSQFRSVRTRFTTTNPNNKSLRVSQLTIFTNSAFFQRENV